MDMTKTDVGVTWQEVTIAGALMRLQNRDSSIVEILLKDVQATPEETEIGSPLEQGDVAEFNNETRYLYVRASRPNTYILTW